MPSAVQRIMSLFAGFEGQHGTHGTPDLDPNGLKWSIKRTARTLRKPVTLEMWQEHVDGKRPLGIIPIREDSSCVWGSIDIDDYEIDQLEVVKRVESAKLPLVPCRSKSGGLHLFMFVENPVQAELMQSTLRDVAASLGFGDCEIFPKQTRILVSQGDQGNWMVMPYFGGDFGGKLRMQYGLKKTGAEMTLEEFVSFAEKRRVADTASLSLIRQKKPKKQKAPFGDGPPCLQHMAEGGFPDGGRNNSLFQVGVYLKRAFPSDWQTMMEQDNQKFMRPPLTSEEVQGVIKSLEKKEYEYKCKDQPMVSHCDSMTCRGRKYGVGVGGVYPEITGLAKLNTEPAIWFVDVAGARLNLSTEELQNYPKFHAACMEHTNQCFRDIARPTWLGIVSDAMKDMTIIEAAPDIGVDGMFREVLENFLTNSMRAQKKEDLLRGAPWEDEATGRFYFQLTPLKVHMERQGIKMTRGQITVRIEKMGGAHDTMTIKGLFRNVWYVPTSEVTRPAELDVPELPREEI